MTKNGGKHLIKKYIGVVPEISNNYFSGTDYTVLANQKTA